MFFKNKIYWEKKGLIIKPRRNIYFERSHAMIPTPLKINDDIYRIYYSGRNGNNQSIISYADIKLTPTVKILARNNKPVLSPGPLGCFDDNGVTPSCLVNFNSKSLALFYIGWNPGSTVRMHLFGGLAISENNKTFKRYSNAPIIERNIYDPYLNTAPWVIKINKTFLMYYVSGTEWKNKDLPRYNIKLAKSTDGKNWIRKGKIAIDFKNKSENALARPYVIKDGKIFKMWFSFKSIKYRIGYAESKDGITWERNDKFSNINISKKGFDSDMIEYPVVIKHKRLYYMFYNGNNYGKDGIGLAIGSL
tara:strand:+ start:3931 stop:4848 length:918 start_codon:yes stop_codon:yes gene_type:complete